MKKQKTKKEIELLEDIKKDTAMMTQMHDLQQDDKPVLIEGSSDMNSIMKVTVPPLFLNRQSAHKQLKMNSEEVADNDK